MPETLLTPRPSNMCWVSPAEQRARWMGHAQLVTRRRGTSRAIQGGITLMNVFDGQHAIDLRDDELQSNMHLGFKGQRAVAVA